MYNCIPYWTIFVLYLEMFAVVNERIIQRLSVVQDRTSIDWYERWIPDTWDLSCTPTHRRVHTASNSEESLHRANPVHRPADHRRYCRSKRNHYQYREFELDLLQLSTLIRVSTITMSCSFLLSSTSIGPITGDYNMFSNSILPKVNWLMIHSSSGHVLWAIANMHIMYYKTNEAAGKYKSTIPTVILLMGNNK